MEDGLNVFLRFALYLDLTLLAGLPLICMVGFPRESGQVATAIGLRGLLMAATGAGLGLSLCHMVMLAMVMSGASSLDELGRHIFSMMITATDLGIAWAVRMVSLMLVGVLAVFGRQRRAGWLTLAAAPGLVSLGTIAWSGHGAMDEGGRRYLHFTADIVHLIAAAAWIGALATFALLLRPGQPASPLQLRRLQAGLSRFAWIGTAIVLALVVTGVANYLLTAGPRVSGLLSTQYGLLLLAKLALFALMLALAAANRYRLTPMLARTLGAGHPAAALSALRRSVALETSAALLILAAVAWLGTLDPSQAMTSPLP